MIYSDRQLIGRLLAGLRSRRADIRYRAVMQCFDIGEAAARNICRYYGYHPDEELPDFDDAKAGGIDEGDSVEGLVVKSGPAPLDQEDVCFDCGLEITGAAYPAGNFCELCEPCWALRNAAAGQVEVRDPAKPVVGGGSV